MARKIKIFIVDKRSNLRVVSILRNNLRNYVVISRIGKKNVYERGEYVPVKKKRVAKRKVSEKRRATILRIKGVTLDLPKIRRDERQFLKQIRLLPTIKRGQFARRINPNKLIITDTRDYGSFSEMQANKRSIYLKIMDKLVKEKNPKFLDRMYELRSKLLRDGFVIEIDLYGTLNKKSQRILYLGTINVTGLMIEETSALEGNIVGSSGYLHELEPVIDSAVRGAGGDSAKLVKNNTLNANVTVTNIKLRFNYA